VCSLVSGNNVLGLEATARVLGARAVAVGCYLVQSQCIVLWHSYQDYKLGNRAT